MVAALIAFGTSLFGFFAGMITMRVALSVAALAAVIALTGVMALALNTALATVSATLPTDVVAFAATIIPTNFVTCITVVITAHVIRWAYDKNVSTIKRIAG